MRVLITVNPGLVSGENLPTVSALVSALDEHCDLTIAPVDGYDFYSKKVRAFRRTPQGKFEETGMVVPEADLWIVYSDGFWLDAKALGFRRRMDFHQAQIDLHEHHLAKGNVRMIINSPAAEERTLKSWLATLDPGATSVIPTYCLRSFAEVRDLRKKKGALIAKLAWGGAMKGLRRLACDADVDAFEAAVQADHPYNTIQSFCFQDYAPAAVEKRFYIAGGQCIGTRQLTGRWLPWRAGDNEQARRYDERTEGYCSDLAAVERLVALSELTVGSIDFVGSRINEVNGGGTVFTYEDHEDLDFRQALVDSFLQIVKRA